MASQLGHANLLIFHVQTKKSHSGSIEDGIFLSGSDGERLQRQRQVADTDTMLAPHTAVQFKFSFYFQIWSEHLKYSKICTIRKFPTIRYSRQPVYTCTHCIMILLAEVTKQPPGARLMC